MKRFAVIWLVTVILFLVIDLSLLATHFGAYAVFAGLSLIGFTITACRLAHWLKEGIPSDAKLADKENRHE